ncbi:MAG: serine/threonine protein kinase [Sphingomonadales bacterium]|nr:MAG: serine/threonine protein kinase [Sphingomonadales bacterium]
MQYVHTAYDQLVGVNVAIKTPKAGQAGTRFKKSAIVAAKVNSHYVAKTLDYVEVSANERYLVEELVEGSTLKESVLAVAGYVDPHLAARLLSKLAKGLAASHHAQVIHRDLKPSNIMVRGGFNLLDVKITDFGIATLTDELFVEELANGRDLTQSTSGTVKGALPYMAPEMMFRKRGDTVGMAADVWSLGALIFEAVTGQYAFGEGLFAPANVMAGKIAPWPPFMTSNPQFAPLAEALQNIILECLQLDPSKRPTADDLAARCIELCYFTGERHEGVVQNIAHVYGFIQGAGGKTFFHPKNVYGNNAARTGTKVVFCRTAGSPYPRAFPMIAAK